MLQLKPGDVVADIGAGSGYYARRIADKVGASGRVYAVDVQPEMVDMLRALAKQRAYANITPVLGGVSDVKLPAASVDLAIMVDVYHELEHPYEVMESIVRAVNAVLTTKKIAGVNHLFQHAKTGLSDEYIQIDETFDPGTLDTITTWLVEQAK